jgi:hypothetical protein
MRGRVELSFIAWSTAKNRKQPQAFRNLSEAGDASFLQL